MSPAGQGDDRATFLAEFRALRDRAAIDYEELAARAHYPTDIIIEAESGPGLPGLPVLAAYVRACGGDVLEWEERWRRLASDAGDDSGLPMRPAGASPAAVAGARAGVSVAAAEAHDAERIKAALRAHREREELAERGRATAHQEASPVSRVTDPLASATGPATMIANGNHHKKPRPDGFNAWMAPNPQTQTPQAQTPETQTPQAQSPQTRTPETDAADESAARAWAVPAESEDWGSSSSWAQEPSLWPPDPPTRTEEQPSWTPEPPAWSQETPAWSQETSVWSRAPRPVPPPQLPSAPAPPAPADEDAPQAINVANEPSPAKNAADATATARAWATSAVPESSAAQRPVAAIRAAASETAPRVTVAQAATASRANRSGHRGLLLLIVIVVIIGCIALLSLT